MASLRYGRDRQLNHLKQESKKLHAEVEALEDALLLHQRYKKEDDTSVRGILRKEIGGSRWQHGGQGKLKTYKNSKDLEDPDKSITKRRRRRNIKDDKPTAASKVNNDEPNLPNELRSKPLNVPSKNASVNSALNSESKIKIANQGTNKVKENNDKRKDTREKNDLNIDSKLDEVDRVSALKKKVLRKASTGVIPRNPKPVVDNAKKSVVLASEGKSLSKKDESNDVEMPPSVKFSDNTMQNNDDENYPKEDRLENKPPASKMRQTNIKPSQALERSRDNEVFKILSMPSNSRTSLKTKDSLNDSTHLHKGGDSVSKCDPLVKKWVKSLGLLEEEKYLKLFADNEIDMAELSQLTPLQLNEMGITAFGALNKILRGIKDLKRDSPPDEKNITSSHDLKNKLNSSIDGRQSKTMESLNRSLTFEERLNDINQYRTSLRRSRSFASSTSKALYSSSNIRSSLDDWAVSKRKEEPTRSADSGIDLTKSDEAKNNNISKPPTSDKTAGRDAKNISPVVSSLQGKQVASEEKKTNSKENLDARVEKKMKSLKTRSKSPARPASSPSKRKGTSKQVENASDSDSTPKKKVDSEKDGSDKAVKKKSLERQNSGKTRKGPVLWPRAKSAQQADRKAKEGVAAAAKRFNNKQKQLTEKEEKQIKARQLKKAQRDEMAARHELRLQNGSDFGSQDNLLDDEGDDGSDLEPEINDLISVTVLDKNYRNDYKDERTVIEDRPVERTRPRTAGPTRQSIHNPVYLEADFSDIRPKSRHDGSRRSEVKSIEAQIEALQSKALSGEMVTMDLVKDLQMRLEELEYRIKDSRPPKLRMRRSEHKTPKKGRDVVTQEMEYRVDPRLARSPIEGSSDPLKSIEIDSSDIMYDSTDLIDEGTFCKVYHGVCSGKEVAIKQLKIPLTSHDKNYFAAEVSLLKELYHPRVVQLLGVCTSEKYPVMVLEFMAKGSLFHYIHNPNCASMDHAEYYGVSHDIAMGMNYLHQHKPQVLHLDLKSMNVLLDSSGRAKVADFGFSKFRHDADMRASKARKKDTGGSPKWMAPELLETGEITTKADVYSFGIILWEMLTRCHPYEGCTVFQILERVRRNKRPEIPPSCPPDLSDLIQRCWHQNHARRPAFKDIISQLDKLAFPPDWRALFKEAGVPSEALEDVQSARTIISLVNNTLDLENVKSMMEDIKHSDDAIRASHDLTKRSHDSTRTSHDSSSQSSDFSEPTSVIIQTRNPQRSVKSSLRWSHDLDFDLRNEKPFNSSKTRTSVDLETRKSESKPKEKSQEEDTTAEYLKYLKASCDILSPTIRSPSSRRQNQLQEFISSELKKSDDSGAVIETYSSIPPLNSDSKKSLLSDKKLHEQKREELEKELKSAKAALEKQLRKDLQPRTKSPEDSRSDLPEAPTTNSQEIPRTNSTDSSRAKSPEASRTSKTDDAKTDSLEDIPPMSGRKSALSLPNMLQEQIKNAKLNKREENIRASMKTEDVSPDLKQEEITQKLTTQDKKEIQPETSAVQNEPVNTAMRKSQDLLLKEMLNSKAYSRRDMNNSQSVDQSKLHSSKVRKSHDITMGDVKKPRQKPEVLSKSFDSSKLLSDRVNVRGKSTIQELSVALPNCQKNVEKKQTMVKPCPEPKQPSTGSESVKSQWDNAINKEDSSRTGSDVLNTAEVSPTQNPTDVESNQTLPNDRKIKTFLSGNVMDEMKSLHNKLRNEKTENVQEIKSLHSKLRTEKVIKKEDGQQGSKVKEQENSGCERDSIEILDLQDDFDKILDLGDNNDHYSEDSLDLNDSLTEDLEQDIRTSCHSNKGSSEKGDKKVETSLNYNDNQNSNSAASLETKTETLGKEASNLRMSLNMEIANFSLNKNKLKKVTSKDSDSKKHDDSKKKSEKSKKKETKQKAIQNIPAIDKSAEPKTRTKDTKASSPATKLPGKSIEAWVEEKPVTASPREKTRKTSTSSYPLEEKSVTASPREKTRKISASSFPQHPPPIVIPDEPFIPPAPPLPIIQVTQSTSLQETAAGETTLESEKEAEKSKKESQSKEKQKEVTGGEIKRKGDKTSSKRVRMEIPAAKVSSKEAQISNLSTPSKEGGDGQLVLKSADLRDQKEVLQSISKPHPNQLHDLSQINKQAYSSIAEILRRATWTDFRRAVFDRREAMGEDSPSPSVASSWSFVDD